MKFTDTINCWEDTAYVLLGDCPIENDSERSKKFQNYKIDFYAADVSVHKYSSDMKVNFTSNISVDIFAPFCQQNYLFIGWINSSKINSGKI